MKILHTSDWHLGRLLYGRSRYDEFEEFLAWLLDTIKQKNIDILLIAGDIFDTTTPSHRAQQLYYRFLGDVSKQGCRHVVVIGGNHDSPTFLNAPKELLQAMNVHVVGAMSESIDDEVIVLNDEAHNPEAIICAVPYLRDKDIRRVDAGESIDDKNQKLIQGLKDHYQLVCERAKARQDELREIHQDRFVPLIGMGHLFAAGSQTVEGDGVRDLYVGSLAHVTVTVFPDYLDYVALGHLHVPQRVGKCEHIRYCGSPIAMGFGEAKQQKKVIVIELGCDERIIEEIDIPRFQALYQVKGDITEIEQQIEAIKACDISAWLEIEYTGKEVVPELRQLIEQSIEGSDIEIRRVKNKRLIDQVLIGGECDETIGNIEYRDVFLRCLECHEIIEADRKELLLMHDEIINTLNQADVNAE